MTQRHTLRNAVGQPVYWIHSARTGHVVDCLWTDRRILVPYALSGYLAVTDLSDDHNETTSVASYLRELSRGPGCRVLSRGMVSQ